MSGRLLKLGGDSSARMRRFGWETNTTRRSHHGEEEWQEGARLATGEGRRRRSAVDAGRIHSRDALRDGSGGRSGVRARGARSGTGGGVWAPLPPRSRPRSVSGAGHGPSSLVLAGRRVRVKRPRVRSTNGSEVVLPSWAAWSAEDPLERRAVEQMLVGVSTRKYARSLEELPSDVGSSGVSKSAVSERFVRGTQKHLQTVQERDLSGLDLKVLFLDGVHFRKEHVVIAAVGVDATGSKHVLGLWEGATENAACATALLENLAERGLRTDRSLLIVLDGSKALVKAVRAVFGKRALIQRCQVHKKRNALDALPEGKRVSVKRALNEAFAAEDHARAKRLLQNLIRTLKQEHPGAAASLREGLEELLTVKRLALGDRQLERMLSSTNLIENLIGQARDCSRRVKRWQGGLMMLRWTAAGVLEAERHFRRIMGYKAMQTLVAALQKHDAELDPSVPNRAVGVAA
ncbi:MAG: IS256 family transposase [Gemmatimonas sp.]|nr:IS256 family transposase [Gemmatimonas sp.]